MTATVVPQAPSPVVRTTRLRGSVARSGVVLLSLLAILAGVLGASSGVAKADATGCANFGGFTLYGVSIPKGNFCGTVTGRGTYVYGVNGNFSAAGTVCNSSITAEFFDSRGAFVKSYSSPISYGCRSNSWSNSPRISIYDWSPAGSVCITLRSNGTRLTSVCHGLY